MRGTFCNRCGRNISESEIFFTGIVYPMRGEEGVRDEELFYSARFDFCNKCFVDITKKISTEYRYPFIERTGDGTRYRVN